MDFRCPSCQKDLTVPDEYAGQLMKCPLCQNSFQAPALPPPPPLPLGPVPNAPSAAAPPAAAEQPYRVIEEAPPSPPPLPSPLPSPPSPISLTAAPPAPPPPVGDYSRTSTLWISPRVVPWIAPVSCLLVFLLQFFPWIYFLPEPPKVLTDERISWGLGFSEGNALTILYLLLFLAPLLLVAAITAVRLIPIPIQKLPAVVQQLWPWRSAIVSFFLLLTFFFLLLQLFIGFSVYHDKVLVIPIFLFKTAWLWLAGLLHLIALIAALLDFWLELRGSSRPIPRIQISW
jgi:hypothetical protein